MNVLGFSGITRGEYYQRRYGLRFVGHDSSVALIRDGRIVFALEEERASRRKHTSELPVHAIDAALACAGMSLEEVDLLAYPWHVNARRFAAMCVRHHLAHAACAFFTSGFEEAAVLTVDGQGEDESATLGAWHGTRYTHFQSVHSPHSIGILYGLVTDFLGMRAAWDEYQVMAMAALGDPQRFAGVMRELVILRSNGRYRTPRTALVFQPGYCDHYLARAFKVKPRLRDEPLAQVHFDIAAALQAELEGVLLHLLRRLRGRSESKNLCLAGGVFLNSVANGKIRRSGLFERVFVPPAPGDHGAALGAALAVHASTSGIEEWRPDFTPFLGPDYRDEEIAEALALCAARCHVHTSPDPVSEAAERLANEQIIGWFQGRPEYGPRALGHRSILANPARAAMKDLVNERIKHREAFRPFAGAVPLDDAREFFEIEGATPYMQFVLPVRPQACDRIAGVTHRGTCRAQTVTVESDPLFYRLLKEIGRRTGTPVLLNTSFNDRDEPIVCSPSDAIKSFLGTNLDALIIGNHVVTKRECELGPPPHRPIGGPSPPAS